MTVRDPLAASQRWTRWDSGTDGESPEERGARGRAARCRPASVPGAPEPATGRCDGRSTAMRAALAASRRPRHHQPQPAGRRRRPRPRRGARRHRRDGPARRPARRGPRARRGRRAGPRRHRRRHPRALPAHRPHRPLHQRPARGRRRPGRRAPARTPRAAAGGGAHVLRDAGVDVEDRGARRRGRPRPLEAWLTAQPTGRPFVTWKYAATLDGRSAAADGTSRWITGEPARADVHRLRAEADAVLVGVGTVLADDPQLTVPPRPGPPAAARRARPLRPHPAAGPRPRRRRRDRRAGRPPARGPRRPARRAAS